MIYLLQIGGKVTSKEFVTVEMLLPILGNQISLKLWTILPALPRPLKQSFAKNSVVVLLELRAILSWWDLVIAILAILVASLHSLHHRLTQIFLRQMPCFSGAEVSKGCVINELQPMQIFFLYLLYRGC